MVFPLTVASQDLFLAVIIVPPTLFSFSTDFKIWYYPYPVSPEVASLSKLLGLLRWGWVIGHFLRERYIQCLHSNLISSFVVVGLLLGVHSEQRESMFTWRSYLNKISGHPRTPAHAPTPGTMDVSVKVSFL